uniref:Uncharacterized protein n=1 Tax=Tanacetum cinerariifolium TaxID=118510 RepID=A0A699HPK3_TANCI|nr:hypothetical protein [Tanacetum cinerariifolium]
MSTQQDIYAAGSENCPPMLNKDNYVPWSSRIIRYARSRPNGKMIVDSIENRPYVRRMIATPGEPDLPVPVPESFHEQTDEELTKTDIKRMDADDQAIQTILLGLPEDVYAAKRHLTIVCQTKNLHEADFTQIYDFLKMNHDEVNELRTERLAKSHDPLALMAHSQSSYNFPKTHKDQSSSSTHSQQSFLINNKYEPSLNQKFMQPPMTSLKDINDLTEAMNADRQTQNVGGIGGNQFRQYAGQVKQNHQGYNAWKNCGIQVAQNAVENSGGQSGGLRVLEWGIKPGTITADDWVILLGTTLPDQEEGICSDLDEIMEVNANCILMANLQQGSTSGTQLDKAPVYDTYGLAEVQLNDNYYDNEIFNMFTQEEQYTDLLEPIPEPQLVSHNDNHITFVAPSMVHSEGTIDTSFAPNEETHAHQETVYRNLVDQVAQTMHMLNPKPDSFYHPNQKMALGYPNPSYLKKAQLKQQSLYNENFLLEEHDPPVVYDSEETLELAQESREKMRFLKKEIKPTNYAKINHLSGVFVPQMTKSKEELFLSNVSNMVTISKTISIPNEDLSDDTTPSVARKFLNEVKSSLVTLQRVVKQKMTLEVHNWSSSAHKEVHEIISYEIAPIINQVDARVQNFEIQFLQEAAKFVRDFKSLAMEADESLDKQKSLELEIK